jgi:hypothetical protein
MKKNYFLFCVCIFLFANSMYAQQPLHWDTLVGVDDEDEDELIKTVNEVSWTNAYGISEEVLTTSDFGYVEFTIMELDHSFQIGLSSAAGELEFDFSYRVVDNILKIYEGGSLVDAFEGVEVEIGDVFRIRKSGANIFYEMNGGTLLLLRESVISSDLYVHFAINNIEGKISKVGLEIPVACVPTITVNASPSGGSLCSGTNVTFTTSISNGGGTPTYQWKDNGDVIIGATSNQYIASPLPVGNHSITCTMTSSALCASPTSVTSTPKVITVTQTVTPSVSISANHNNICVGTSVTFTATPTNGGSPTYVWRKNGTTISGQTGVQYTASDLAHNDQIICVMTSSLPCVTSSIATVTSNAINMVVYTVNVNLGADKEVFIGNNTSIGGSGIATGGTAPYTYEWSPSTGLSATNIANPVASLESSLEYTLNVTDANGCTGTDKIIVNILFPGYGSLTTSEKGNFQTTDNSRLYFEFTEKYAVASNATLNYKIIKLQNRTTINTASLAAMNVKKGYNKFELNLAPLSLTSGYYLLEVTDIKQKKSFMKFYIP